MQSVQEHYCGAESSAPLSKNSVALGLRLESWIDSFTFRYKFMVQNFMAVKKHDQHDFDFFSSFFHTFFWPWLIILFPLLALWLQLDLIFVNRSFVANDDPSQEFITVVWSFPINASLVSLHVLLRSEQFRHHLGANLFHLQVFSQNPVHGLLSQTKCFWYRHNSHLAVTEHDRTHAIDVFKLTRGGGAS